MSEWMRPGSEPATDSEWRRPDGSGTATTEATAEALNAARTVAATELPPPPTPSVAVSATGSWSAAPAVSPTWEHPAEPLARVSEKPSRNRVVTALVSIAAMVALGGLAALVFALANGGDEPSPIGSSTGSATAAPATEPPTVTAVLLPSDPISGSSLTPTQQRAANEAAVYLDEHPESRREVIRELTDGSGEWYSEEDATIAVDSLNLDWGAQATRRADHLLEFGVGYSQPGLTKELVRYGFSAEDAEQAVSSITDDEVWSRQAVIYVQGRVANGDVSRGRLIDLLIDPEGFGFTVEQATATVDQANADWEAEAVAAAADYVSTYPESATCDRVTNRLESMKFTPAEVEFAVASVGVC